MILSLTGPGHLTFEDKTAFEVSVDIQFQIAEHGWIGTGKISSDEAAFISRKKGYGTLKSRSWQLRLVATRLDDERTLSVLTPDMPFALA